MEPFHVFQLQEKRCLGAEPLESKYTVLKLLPDNIREQRAGESPQQVIFFKTTTPQSIKTDVKQNQIKEAYHYHLQSCLYCKRPQRPTTVRSQPLI